jgi:hypothetical protein
MLIVYMQIGRQTIDRQHGRVLEVQLWWILSGSIPAAAAEARSIWKSRWLVPLLD